jgi:hypothetical protein
MNTDTMKGQWHQLKGEAKAQWGKLTNDELDHVRSHPPVEVPEFATRGPGPA